jgi:hypothetical protein
MKLPRSLRRLVDRAALHPVDAVPVWFSFSPLLAYILAIQTGWASRSDWGFGLAFAASALLGVVTVVRGLKFGRRFMRPTDKARDEWARRNQSGDYR